jgi:hypothetical protein
MKLKVKIAQKTGDAVLCGRGGRWAWVPLSAISDPPPAVLVVDPGRAGVIKMEKKLAVKKGLAR